jgi:hypothetical protein
VYFQKNEQLLIFLPFLNGADLGNCMFIPKSKLIEINTINHKNYLLAGNRFEQRPNQGPIFRLHYYCIPNLERSLRTHLYPVAYMKYEHIRIWYLDKHF